MPEDRPITPLDIKNAEERRIVLEGPKDPDHFVMPDGRTLTETRQQMLDEHTKEGLAAEEAQTARARELSTRGDALYNPSMKVEAGDHGTMRVVAEESKAEESSPSKGTPATPVPSQPAVSNTTPEKGGVITGDKASQPSK